MRERLLQMARDDAPFETVGLIAGNAIEFTALAPLRNHSPTPTVAFYAEPESYACSAEALEAQGHELLGFYHSHPESRAEPSRADLMLCPHGWLMVIVAPEHEEVRCWTPSGEEVELVEWEPEEDL